MKSRPKISTVIFDLDGVLVDATEWHFNALNRALNLFGFNISRFEHLSAYNGLPTRKKLEMLSLEKDLPRALHRLINSLKQVYTREEILLHCRPSFEKEYMLSRLARENYRLAVCSNAVRDSVELMLRQTGIYQCFELVLSNEDVTQPKPHPEVYLNALQRLGVGAAEVLVVEDAPHGIASAQAAGAHLCEVAGYPEVDYWRIQRAIQAIERRESSHA